MKVISGRSLAEMAVAALAVSAALVRRPLPSPLFKFMSAMLTYFGSFGTSLQARNEELKEQARRERRFLRFLSAESLAGIRGTISAFEVRRKMASP